MLVLLEQIFDTLVVPHKPRHLWRGRIIKLGSSCQPFLETSANRGGPSLRIIGTRCLIGGQRDVMDDQRDLSVVDEGITDKREMKSALGSINDMACVCRVASRF